VPRARPPLPLLLGIVAILALSLAHTAEIRERAEAALGRGMPGREEALARGFVLGQDDRIDPRTVEDFRRSGLSHLLAVSGQNVALLALLAMPLLGALGIPLRARLVWILALIAVYVPLAGAGPSIQRAGVMGALSVLATLAGRRAARLYGLALAALVTLAVEPAIASDVGWQLSFAAVLGILLLAAPLRGAIAARIGARGLAGVLAEGAAMTIAATLATAPLIAFHFGAVATMTVLANLLALPAVAPAMWLGMLAAAIGQVPGIPVEPVNALNAPLLAYIAQVAAWCGRPRWAYLEVRFGLWGLLASYVALALAVVLIAGLRLHLRRRIAALRPPSADGPIPDVYGWKTAHRRGRWGLATISALALTTLAVAWGVSGGGRSAAAPPIGLRISALDVGQGDAILLQPGAAPPVLVDTGPAGAGLGERLRAAGVERLGAVILTHDQSDHVGAVPELLAEFPVERVVFAELGRVTLAVARASGALPARISAGAELRSGRLRLEILWPPRELLAGPDRGEDPNHLAVVALARWRDFSMLLSADAEAEAVPLDPGPIDVLKVAHHGSADAGLEALLARTGPRLAVISVGDDNPFGHPTAGTLATLAAHGVRTLRTDVDGTLTLDVGTGKGVPRTGGYSERAKRASPGGGRPLLP
jgi:competence protein ComEC